MPLARRLEVYPAGMGTVHRCGGSCLRLRGGSGANGQASELQCFVKEGSGCEQITQYHSTYLQSPQHVSTSPLFPARLPPLHSSLALSECFRQSAGNAATAVARACFASASRVSTVSRLWGGLPTCGAFGRRSRGLGLAVCRAGRRRGRRWRSCLADVLFKVRTRCPS